VAQPMAVELRGCRKCRHPDYRPTAYSPAADYATNIGSARIGLRIGDTCTQSSSIGEHFNTGTGIGIGTDRASATPARPSTPPFLVG